MTEFLSKISRRKFVALAGSSAMGATLLKASQPAVAAENEAALYEAAKKEGTLVFYSALFTKEILDETGKAFTKKYPGISFEGVREKASTVFKKINQELKSGLKVTDVFATTDISQMLQLKEQKQLLQYKPLGQQNILEPYRHIDPENFYQTSAISPIIIAYNSQKLAAADAPKTWLDLTKDKYLDLIVTGSGAASGHVGTWALAMQQKYGWDKYIEKFNKLNPKLRLSINDVIPILVSGERVLGATLLGQAWLRKVQGDPIEVVYPADGTVVVVCTVGILKNAPHPNASKLFLNFLMSKEYSELLTTFYEQPLRGDVKLQGAKPASEIKVIIPTPQEIEKGLPDIIKKWRNTFGS